MQIAFTEEQEALRKELRAYFADLMTPEVQEEMASGDGEYGNGDLYKRLVRQMGQDGWLGIGWPTEYGGQNRSMIEQLIFMDEASLAGAPVPFLTINTVGPTLMHFGTDEQRKEFLPEDPRRRAALLDRLLRARRPAPTSPRSPPGPCATARST